MYSFVVIVYFLETIHFNLNETKARMHSTIYEKKKMVYCLKSSLNLFIVNKCRQIYK